MKVRPVQFMIFAILGASGCATTGDNGLWPRLVASSQTSIKQKTVWIPLVTAAVFAASSADREVSEWAIKNKPIFGSVDSAEDWSGWLAKGLVATALLSSYARLEEDYQPLAADSLALGGAYAFSAGLKRVSNRTRPNKKNDLSFPSSHATMAFGSAQIAARNFSALDTPYANVIQLGLYTFASASAWGRVESATHYPSDVLAGAAIGNFFAGTANSFLEDRENVTVSYVPTYDGGELRIQCLFH